MVGPSEVDEYEVGEYGVSVEMSVALSIGCLLWWGKQRNFGLRRGGSLSRTRRRAGMYHAIFSVLNILYLLPTY